MAALKKQETGAGTKTNEGAPRFTKGQILASARYSSQRDVVDALLDEKKEYTLEHVDRAIEEFMKGKVG